MVSLADFLLEQGMDKTYWVAYSGGLDSHVLLHQLTQYPIKLKAIHVHHGLSPYADDWVAHCARVCAELKVEFVWHKISIVAEQGKSPEELARQYRYGVFESLLSTKEHLLTAHHQDDQAETVLLQLLRGTGLKGLAAMPQTKKLGHGFHHRPFLKVTRDTLKKYADSFKLQWIEDESNAKMHFTRNFLRHEILPLLQTRWPTVAQTLSRVADHCAEAQQVLDDVAQIDLSQAAGSVSNTLSVAYLKKLSVVYQRLILREWLSKQGCSLPSTRKMNHILSDMLYAREDKMPQVSWANVQLRRYRDNLFFMNVEFALTTPSVETWQTRLATKQTQPVTVRFRQGGERCRLPGRTCHHSLKKLFQEWNIPPWERDRIPLIYVGDELAVIVGYAVCEGFVFA